MQGPCYLFLVDVVQATNAANSPHFIFVENWLLTVWFDLEKWTVTFKMMITLDHLLYGAYLSKISPALESRKYINKDI